MQGRPKFASAFRTPSSIIINYIAIMSQQDVPMGDDGSSDSEHSLTDSHVSMTEDQFEENPSPKDDQYERIASMFDGKRPEDFNVLRRMNWVEQPPDVQQNWQVYIPDWTRPGWDPSVRTSMDGKYKRAAFRNEETAMRPTIMPGDQEPRTDSTLYVVLLPDENERAFQG